MELRLVLPEAPSDCGEVYTINSKGTTTPPAVIVKEKVRSLLYEKTIPKGNVDIQFLT